MSSEILFELTLRRGDVLQRLTPGGHVRSEHEVASVGEGFVYFTESVDGIGGVTMPLLVTPTCAWVKAPEGEA